VDFACVFNNDYFTNLVFSQVGLEIYFEEKNSLVFFVKLLIYWLAKTYNVSYISLILLTNQMFISNLSSLEQHTYPSIQKSINRQ
jgi:hypothetical protein